MKIQPGWRYRVVLMGEGEFEAVLLGPAPPDVWAEGGGEVVMPRWQVRTDDGRVVDVQEAALTVINPRALGPQPGPVACPACEGTGARAKPGQLSKQPCPSCEGGIAYPAHA
jgi:hypothetical protein